MASGLQIATRGQFAKGPTSRFLSRGSYQQICAQPLTYRSYSVYRHQHHRHMGTAIQNRRSLSTQSTPTPSSTPPPSPASPTPPPPPTASASAPASAPAPARSHPRAVHLGFNKKHRPYVLQSAKSVQGQSSASPASSATTNAAGEITAEVAQEASTTGGARSDSGSNVKPLKLQDKLLRMRNTISEKMSKNKKVLRIFSYLAVGVGIISVTYPIWSSIILCAVTYFSNPSTIIQQFLVGAVSYQTSPSLYYGDGYDSFIRSIQHLLSPTPSWWTQYLMLAESRCKAMLFRLHSSRCENNTEKYLPEIQGSYVSLLIPSVLLILIHRTAFNPTMYEVFMQLSASVKEAFPVVSTELESLISKYKLAAHHREIVARRAPNNGQKDMQSSDVSNDDDDEGFGLVESKMMELQKKMKTANMSTIVDKSMIKGQFSGLGPFEASAHDYASTLIDHIQQQPRQFQEVKDMASHFHYYFGSPIHYQTYHPRTAYDQDWLDIPLGSSGTILPFLLESANQRSYRERYKFKTGDYECYEPYFPNWKYVTSQLHYKTTRMGAAIGHYSYQESLIYEAEQLISLQLYLYPFYFNTLSPAAQEESSHNKQRFNQMVDITLRYPRRELYREHILKRIRQYHALSPLSGSKTCSPDVQAYIDRGYRHPMYTRFLTSALLDEPSVQWPTSVENDTIVESPSAADRRIIKSFFKIWNAQDEEDSCHLTELEFMRAIAIPPEYSAYYTYDPTNAASEVLAASMYLFDKSINAILSEIERVDRDVEKEIQATYAEYIKGD